jgi:hypothetical protein
VNQKKSAPKGARFCRAKGFVSGRLSPFCELITLQSPLSGLRSAGIGMQRNGGGADVRLLCDRHGMAEAGVTQEGGNQGEAEGATRDATGTIAATAVG